MYCDLKMCIAINCRQYIIIFHNKSDIWSYKHPSPYKSVDLIFIINFLFDQLGKYTSLKSAVILGGENMEDQFEALHGNPDIIVATPGRLMHVLVEMDLRLTNVEYLVFDEADR